MLTRWTKFIFITAILCVFTVASGCSSSLKKVVNEDAPTMQQMYNEYTTGDPEQLQRRHDELLLRPAISPENLQLGVPPYPEHLDHLYPRLPNPDLFMYVRPHAIGATGAPIPAYITRFTMYERQPYALPGETLTSLKSVTEFRVDRRAVEEQQESKNKSGSKKQGAY